MANLFDDLKEPMGPLPVWGWAAIGGVGIALVAFVMKRRGQGTGAAQITLTPAPGGGTAGGGGGGGFSSSSPYPTSIPPAAAPVDTGIGGDWLQAAYQSGLGFTKTAQYARQQRIASGTASAQDIADEQQANAALGASVGQPAGYGSLSWFEQWAAEHIGYLESLQGPGAAPPNTVAPTPTAPGPGAVTPVSGVPAAFPPATAGPVQAAAIQAAGTPTTVSPVATAGPVVAMAYAPTPAPQNVPQAGGWTWV